MTAARVKIASAARQALPRGVSPRPAGNCGRMNSGKAEASPVSLSSGCQPATRDRPLCRDNHVVQADDARLPGSEGPRPHSTAAGVRGGRSVFSSVNTAWTCCSDQPIRLFISTCCSSAAAPPARTQTGTEQGAQEGCQTFTASPGIAACHNRSRLIALPTCPCSASGTAYPVC
ncbi:Uncharacterised protein [Klebsiella pneumoniae]|nr:Uncharacterised protein [Klebsiella pneumoniae]